jgi:hypothetical protein
MNYHAGQPLLPVYTTTLTFPFATKIVDITCEPNVIKTEVLSDKILPAPQPMLQDGNYHEIEHIMNEEIYNSEDYFPETWFTYHTGGGLDSNSEHKTFLTIRAYPVRYSPAADTIIYTDHFDITITYSEPETNPLPTNSEFDMVIITPSELHDTSLDDFIAHKNNMGVKTFIKTLEDIYPAYSGEDEPEQIKYFIKDAIETFGIKYVLIVGGLTSYIWARPRDDDNKGVTGWYVPVRYTNMRYEGTAKIGDPGFLSDLYYADIYDSEAGFSSWDSNGDGTYAWWGMFGTKDILDVWPDVYVGRLACRNVWEVKIMTNKIINYEQNAYGQSWYNKMICVGGDSFHDAGTEFLEGEIVSDKILETYMTEYNPTRIYASYKDTKPTMTPVSDNIIREVSSGSGHLFFDGHANPSSWNTHWPGEETWTGGIQVNHFPRFRNGEKLPVLCVEGCHNSQYNVSLVETFLDDRDLKRKMWTYGLPIPECWSWWFARKIGGGSLATIGNTGLGYGAVGEHGDQDGDGNNEPDPMEALGGYLFIQFYKTFDEDTDILGEVWGGAINKYLTTFPPMEDQLDTKEMQQWALLGDPSLKIGGYPSTGGFKARIVDAGAGVNGYPNIPISFTATTSGGQAPYTYLWDFDEDDIYTRGDITEQWSWNENGVYTISLKVIDANANEAFFNTVVGIDSKPPKPTGPTSGKTGEEYTYTASVTDSSLWDTIYYYFDWGDGTTSGPYESEANTVTVPHTWNSQGFFNVKAKAILIDTTDYDYEETGWSDPLSVAMPKDSQPVKSFLQRFIELLVEKFPALERILEHPAIERLFRL